MTNSAQILKGLLDVLVLSVLERGGDNYGFGILQSLRKQIGDRSVIVKDATLYPLLHRLEGKNLLESYSTDGDRGTARKYYRLTKAGRNHLKESLAAWQDVIEVVQHLHRR